MFGVPAILAVLAPRPGWSPIVVAAFAPPGTQPGKRSLGTARRLARRLGHAVGHADEASSEHAITRELTRRTREMAALHQMAARLSLATSADTLISTILEGARRVMRCDSAALYVRGHLRDELEPLAIQGFTAEERRQLNLQAADLLSYENQPDWGMLVRKIGSKLLTSASKPDLLKRRPVHADILCSPLTVDGNTIGVLFLGGRQPGALGPGEYHLANSMAEYAAIAVANAQLVEAKESQVRSLSTLSRFGQAVAESLRTQHVFRAIVRTAADALAPSNVAICLLDDARTELIVAATHLESPADDVARRMPLEGSLVGWVVRHGVPLVVPSRETPSVREIAPFASNLGVSSMIGAPIFAQGEIVGALTAFSITDRRYAPGDLELVKLVAAQVGIAIEQAKLHQSVMQDRAKLEAIVQSLQEGLILIDTQRRIAFTSRQSVDLVGLDVQQQLQATIDMVWSRLAEDADDPADVRARLAALEAQPAAKAMLTLVRPTRRELSVQSFTVRDEGTTVGRGYLLRDITREMEIERVKSTLLSTVSHELRTPLSAIKGFASALLHDGMHWDEASQREFLTQIDREADRLTALVRNLLDMSRLETGTLQFEWEVCDLKHVLQDLIQRFAPLVPHHRLQLIVNCTDSRCVIDRRFMERVIWNLVDNAAKYSPAGTPIVVRIARQAQGIVLSVVDQGVGIAPSDRGRIFERFVRGKSVSAISGCGLGLAICRAIVEAHGGSIAVDTSSGGGAVLTVWLPDRPLPVSTA